MIIYLHMRHTAGAPAQNAASNAALAPYYGQVASYHRSVPGAEIRHVYVNDTTTVPQVIAGVTAAAANQRSIWNLMINCHGTPGNLLLGSGVTVWDALSFAGLRPFMTPGGAGITVGCCYAAAGDQLFGTRQGCVVHRSSASNGLTLLGQIAHHSGSRVIGALDEQVTWELNGPILTVLPDGNYMVREGRTVDWIRGPSLSSHDLVCQ